jgi:hypothetical protein
MKCVQRPMLIWWYVICVPMRKLFLKRTKSSSDSNEQRSPCGRKDVDSPIFASQPNIALYGDLFIPE